MSAAQGPARICWNCSYRTHEVKDGADVVACTHQPEGAAEPLHPHAQRTQPADEAANVCGAQGIFWKARQ